MNAMTKRKRRDRVERYLHATNKATAIGLAAYLLLGCLAIGSTRPSAAIQPNKILKVIPSSLEEDVSQLIQRKPRVTAQEVTAHANALLKQKGFNFDFGANEFIKQHAL